MNRIRIYNNKYQVLITPTLSSSASFETLIDNWQDENLLHFYIKEYEFQSDAMYEALNYPDIDWFKLVGIHREHYNMYKNIVKEIIDKNKMVVEFVHKLIDPLILKHMVFDKVMQNDPELKYGLNEIISFKIINPWSKNLKQFAKIFTNYRELHISEQHTSNGKIILNGKTNIGTTYEIILLPTLINHLEQWIQTNKHDTNMGMILKNIYPQMIKIQDEFDKTPILR